MLCPALLCSDAVALSATRERHTTLPPTQAYRCAAKVAASARQTVAFQQAAKGAAVDVLPLLLYYAQLHRFKTELYLSNPDYPPSSSVLQHGVSCRRAKRDSYHWPLDYVHVFREGILQSWMANLCPSRRLPPRLVLGDLLGGLPDMAMLLGMFYPQFVHVHAVHRSDNEQGMWATSRSIATSRNVTVSEWKQAFRTVGESDNQERNPQRQIEPPEPPGMLWLPMDPAGHPWVREDKTGQLYVSDDFNLPEQALHFVLLFTLSSLCRYNPVEWSDIVHWQNEADAGLVREYLRYAAVAVLGEH